MQRSTRTAMDMWPHVHRVHPAECVTHNGGSIPKETHPVQPHSNSNKVSGSAFSCRGAQAPRAFLSHADTTWSHAQNRRLSVSKKETRIDAVTTCDTEPLAADGHQMVAVLALSAPPPSPRCFCFSHVHSGHVLLWLFLK